MDETKKKAYVSAKKIAEDWGCSMSKAYQIIKELSAQMKAENPKLLTMSGKINRIYYEEACLKR